MLRKLPHLRKAERASTNRSLQSVIYRSILIVGSYRIFLGRNRFSKSILSVRISLRTLAVLPIGLMAKLKSAASNTGFVVLQRSQGKAVLIIMRRLEQHRSSNRGWVQLYRARTADHKGKKRLKVRKLMANQTVK